MLYVPVTAKVVEDVQSAQDASEVIQGLSFESLAAISLIQILPDIKDKVSTNDELLTKLNRFLYNFISVPLEERPDVYAKAISLFSLQSLREGMNLMSENGIVFMNVRQIKDRRYLDRSGNWLSGDSNVVAPDFIETKLVIRGVSKAWNMTKEQERLIKIALSDIDEPLNVEGYAGTGKTKIISLLADALDDRTTLFLAMSQQQLNGMLRKIDGNPQRGTFAGIAKVVFESNRIGPVRKIGSRYGMVLDYKRIAQILNCSQLSVYDSVAVAKAAYKTVAAFCYSADSDITLSHVGSAFSSKDSLHNQVVLAHAQALWGIVCLPRNGEEVPIRGYHLIKAMALTHEVIPEQYSHVVVDEAHNLPKPVVQILERSPQAVFSFGDKYQCLDGFSSINVRGENVRSKQMACSVRVGNNASEIYNVVLSRHPVQTEVDFEGAKEKQTEIVYYDKFVVPNNYCAVLTKKIWTIFELAQRFSSKNARFRITDGARRELKSLINAAIYFYSGERTSHFEFYGYDSWCDYVASKRDPVVDKVDRVLEKGYEFTHLMRMLEKEVKDDWDNVYVIGTVSDCRNAEFSRVVLMDDVVENGGFFDYDKSKVVSHIYTGISRAKHELIVPAHLDGWFCDFWDNE
jgi:hypothetical protein